MNAPTSSKGAGNPSPGRPELTVEASEEQLLYAKILNVGMYLGLGILLATFALWTLPAMILATALGLGVFPGSASTAATRR